MKLRPYSANQTYNATGSIKNRTWNLFLSFFIFVGLSGLNAEAQKTFEWPCFHGTDRTNK